MRREELFNRDGVYSAIVNNNLLMHHDATAVGYRILQTLCLIRSQDQPLRILDLACGGLPISIADMIDAVTQARFTYTGIDINPDQVELAATLFEFPGNVVQARLIEANAWDIQSVDLDGPFDLIYTGLNLHHGAPEEIDYLMSQIRALLNDRGVFINHDWYRPDAETYIRRPSAKPEDGQENFRLVPEEKMTGIVNPYPHDTITFDAGVPDWRLAFIDGLTDSYRDLEGDDVGADTLKSHMLERDFPISRADLTAILKKHGFHHRIVDYTNIRVAINPFLAMPFACKDGDVFNSINRHIH